MGGVKQVRMAGQDYQADGRQGAEVRQNIGTLGRQRAEGRQNIEMFGRQRAEIRGQTLDRTYSTCCSVKAQISGFDCEATRIAALIDRLQRDQLNSVAIASPFH